MPHSVAAIINIATGEKSSVDIGTEPCGFYRASSPSWSPDGTRFAFIANHFSGESGESPLELWARRAIKCP
jgi:Tol biopolymer transport system component